MRAAKNAITHNINKLVFFSLRITPEEKGKIKALSEKQKNQPARP
jgi:hypothetical protein